MPLSTTESEPLSHAVQQTKALLPALCSLQTNFCNVQTIYHGGCRAPSIPHDVRHGMTPLPNSVIPKSPVLPSSQQEFNQYKYAPETCWRIRHEQHLKPLTSYVLKWQLLCPPGQLLAPR